MGAKSKGPGCTGYTDYRSLARILWALRNYFLCHCRHLASLELRLLVNGCFPWLTGDSMNFLIKLQRLFKNEDGPTAVEYAVMLALIVGVCVGAVQTLAVATRDNFDRSAQSIDNAINP